MARIQQSIEINVPVHAAYNQLTQFEEYPCFMEDVEQVRQLDDTHLHWHARMSGRAMQWDAEITEQVPDRCIAWRNTSGPVNEGRVELDPLEPARTRVTLIMECDPQQQAAPQQGNPEAVVTQRTGEDLVRFKKFIENRSGATGAWRGEVRDGRLVRPPAPDETNRNEPGEFRDTRQDGGRSGYAGPEGAGAQSMPDSSYAAGSEGWDGNEDPGVPISAGASADAGEDTGQAQTWQDDGGGVRQAGEIETRQQDADTQSAASLSRAHGDAPEQNPVAEEQSFDQQSAQARRVGKVPDVGPEMSARNPAEVLAASIKPEASGAPETHGEEAPGRAAPQNGESSSGAGRPSPSSRLPGFLQGWDEPIAMMRRMTEEMEQVLERLVGRPFIGNRMRSLGSMVAGTWLPPVEIAQHGDRLVVSVELPGIKREDVQIEIRNDRLIIEGDRHEETQHEAAGYRRTERSYGHFHRAVALPDEIDADAASASMRDGVLEITLPIVGRGRPGKRVDIDS